MQAVTWTLENGERRYFVPAPGLTPRQKSELDWFAGCEPCAPRLPAGVTCYHTVRSLYAPHGALGNCWTDAPTEIALAIAEGWGD